MDKSDLLDRLRVSGDERLFLSQVLDRQRQAARRVRPAATDFLSPHEQALARSLLRLAPSADVRSLFCGGPVDAERKLLCFLPDWLSPDNLSPDDLPIRALRASWNPADTLSHRDLLGSLMGLGIVRGKIGDIYVIPAAADVLTLDSVRDFLLQNWQAAGRVKLRVEPVPVDAVRVPVPDAQDFRVTVSSMRLDAVLSAALRLSRAKAAELVDAGRVQLNWLDCAKPERLLQSGDLLSVRGFGRFSVGDVGPLTRKGRVPVTIRRFL